MSELVAGSCEDACISDGEGETPEICGTLTRRARVTHVCCECGDTIQPGETFEVVSGRWAGNWLSFKTCAPCVEIRGTFCCYGWTYGELWRDAEESLFQFLTIGCVAKLESAAAKEKLVARWREWKLT